MLRYSLAACLLLMASATGDNSLVYSIQRDFRKCAAPQCGGYFYKRLNYVMTVCPDGQKSERCYVADIDWGLFQQQQTGLIEAHLETEKLGRLVVTKAWESTCDGCLIAIDCLPPPSGCQYVDIPFDECGCRTGCGQLVCPAGTCDLKPEVGPCDAAFPRWYFDGKDQACKEFTYGGCQGNGNNFFSKEMCEAACGPPTCELEIVPGPCRGVFPRWAFNGKECVEFTYGGCGGNSNNFQTQEECEDRCENEQPDITVCSENSCPEHQYCVPTPVVCVTEPCFQFQCKDKSQRDEKCSSDVPCARGLYCSKGQCVESPGFFYEVNDQGGFCSSETCASFTLDRVNRDREYRFSGQILLTNVEALPLDLERAEEHASSSEASLIVSSAKYNDPLEIDGKRRKKHLHAWEIFLSQDTPLECARENQCTLSVYHSYVASEEGCYCTFCSMVMPTALAERHERSYRLNRCDTVLENCPMVRCQNSGEPTCKKGKCVAV